MFRFFTVFFFVSFLLQACQPDTTVQQAPETLSGEQKQEYRLSQLITTAQTGDLLVRLTDDIISKQVSALNEKDRSFSHCGMVVEKGNNKYVYHIAPNAPGADTIELIPIKQFVEPDSTIRCALYRYQLTSSETNMLPQIIDSFKATDIRFDPVYDLSTNDKLYCSEMISKALTQATGGRMQFREMNVPKQMQKLLVMFFKKQGLSKEIIATRKFISIDNLYLRPDCEELMRFDLKIFPGQ